MRRKEVNRCRREWLGVSLQSDKEVAAWARQFGDAMLSEIRRLRNELKLSNKKRRGVYGRLVKEKDAYELERDDLDALIDKIEALRGQISAQPTDNVSAWWLNDKLDEILNPLLEDHHGEDED
jgi:hypothetical protein